MSWAAHELESYFLQKHVKVKVSYLAVLLGCLLPDLLTKLPVCGLHIGDRTLLKAATPYQYHRGWPGVGPTHSLLFGVLVGVLLLLVTKNRAWALGIVIGQWAHVLTDTFDSAGTMLFFPFSTQHYSFGMWAYAAQAGRYGDAAAYYSSFGGVWDVFWLLMAISGLAVFRREFFFNKIVPVDPVWAWIRRRFDPSEATMVAIYRAFFVYGACRIFGWFFWARFFNPDRGTQTVSVVWGGPRWVDKVTFHWPGWGEFIVNTGVGAVGVALTLSLLWWLLLRRKWAEAH